MFLLGRNCLSHHATKSLVACRLSLVFVFIIQKLELEMASHKIFEARKRWRGGRLCNKNKKYDQQVAIASTCTCILLSMPM
jgi:hypothetical protein